MTSATTIPLDAIIKLVESEIPNEYHGAELSKQVGDMLNSAKALTGAALIVGPPGVGKTRQLWACYRSLRIKQAERIAEDGSEEPAEFVRRFRFQKPRMQIINESWDIARNRYGYDWLEDVGKHPGWLAIDDIGSGKAANDWTMQAIYFLANHRRAWKLPTIWTTNLQQDQLASYFTPAIASRLCGGVIINPEGADRRQDDAVSK